MDLRNKISHKPGTSVSVNGTMYEIGADAIVRDVPKADADKMLQCGDEWVVHTGKKKPVLVKKPAAPKPPVEAPVVEPPEETKAETPEEPGGEAPEAKPEWPEPTEDMDIGYLKQMADAHDVKYSVLIGKEKLIERLKEAMYE